MKKLILVLGAVVFGCEGHVNPTQPLIDPVIVNRYGVNAGENVPLVSIIGGDVQITSIGDFSDGNAQGMEKIYFSDRVSKSEWVSIINEDGDPEFLYEVNTLSNEKMSSLFWVDHTDTENYFLRFYQYDWASRLGTLQFEIEVSGEQSELVFENETSSEGGRLGKKAKSFPVPIFRLNQLEKQQSMARRARVNEDPVDDFDKDALDLMETLKKLKKESIDIPCKVEAIRNTPAKRLICRMSDALNRFVDHEFFEDLEEAQQENTANPDFTYEGSSYKFDVGSFSSFELENLSRHLNRVREWLPDFSFDEWLENLQEVTDVEDSDLNDLSDSEGVIQIGLSWNSSADIDLHVVDPFGEEIYFGNPNSSSGGYLDRDDTDGIGPENIYWSSNIPDGVYTVSLVYFGPDDGPVTDFSVAVINGLGVKEIFNGALGYFDRNKIDVATFRKEGVEIIFL